MKILNLITQIIAFLLAFILMIAPFIIVLAVLIFLLKLAGQSDFGALTTFITCAVAIRISITIYTFLDDTAAGRFVKHLVDIFDV